VVTPSPNTHKGDISMLERHIKAELIRQGIMVNFRELLLLQRNRQNEHLSPPYKADLRTPKQVAVAAGKPKGREEIDARTSRRYQGAEAFRSL
jgi:hypothetical protein